MSLSTTGKDNIYSSPTHTDFRPWQQSFRHTDRILSNMAGTSDRPLKTDSWSSVSYVHLKTKALKANLNAAWRSRSAARNEVIHGKVDLVSLYSLTNSYRHVLRKHSSKIFVPCPLFKLVFAWIFYFFFWKIIPDSQWFGPYFSSSTSIWSFRVPLFYGWYEWFIFGLISSVLQKETTAINKTI